MGFFRLLGTSACDVVSGGLVRLKVLVIVVATISVKEECRGGRSDTKRTPKE